jgi:hypothetical protein
LVVLVELVVVVIVVDILLLENIEGVFTSTQVCESDLQEYTHAHILFETPFQMKIVQKVDNMNRRDDRDNL